MNHLILINNRVTIRRKRSPQLKFRIKLSVLIEINHPQRFRFADIAGSGLQISSKHAQQRRLSAAVRSYKSNAHSRSHRKVEIVEQYALADLALHSRELNQLF